MAGGKLETRFCVAWTTKKSCTEVFGPRFNVSNTVWRLSMKPSADGLTRGVFLHYVDGQEGVINFAITTSLENILPDSLSVLSSVRTVESINKGKSEELWRCSDSDISEAVRDFQIGREFRVVCVFHNVPSSSVESRTETISATPRDFKRPHSSSSNSETGAVVASDLDGAILELFGEYVISGKIPNLSWDTVLKLYAAAVEHAVPNLKKACSDLIIQSLTEENCVRALTSAHTHDDQDLKNEVIKYVVDHIEVIKRQDWIKFEEERSKVAIEMYRIFMHKNNFT